MAEQSERSGVEMAGVAERYWKELRPSAAGRFRLDLSAQYDPKQPGSHLVRSRRRPRVKLTASR